VATGEASWRAVVPRVRAARGRSEGSSRSPFFFGTISQHRRPRARDDGAADEKRARERRGGSLARECVRATGESARDSGGAEAGVRETGVGGTQVAGQSCSAAHADGIIPFARFRTEHDGRVLEGKRRTRSHAHTRQEEEREERERRRASRESRYKYCVSVRERERDNSNE